MNVLFYGRPEPASAGALISLGLNLFPSGNRYTGSGQIHFCVLIPLGCLLDSLLNGNLESMWQCVERGSSKTEEGLFLGDPREGCKHVVSSVVP